MILGCNDCRQSYDALVYRRRMETWKPKWFVSTDAETSQLHLLPWLINMHVSTCCKDHFFCIRPMYLTLLFILSVPHSFYFWFCFGVELFVCFASTLNFFDSITILCTHEIFLFFFCTAIKPTTFLTTASDYDTRRFILTPDFCLTSWAHSSPVVCQFHKKNSFCYALCIHIGIKAV